VRDIAARDGNLHPSFDVVGPDPRGEEELQRVALAAADELVATTLRLGGTVTGEHGIGTAKQRWLTDELGADAVALHHELKAVFDPHGILNPGKGY